ncbi:hypothetical protein ACLOJK_001797 [Asimina triloba]
MKGLDGGQSQSRTNKTQDARHRREKFTFGLPAHEVSPRQKRARPGHTAHVTTETVWGTGGPPKGTRTRNGESKTPARRRAGVMGSLMAGWNSPVSDPKAVKFQRNRSFAKEEIEAYWKSKKRIEEEHLRSISDLSQDNQESLNQEPAAVFQRSSSLPLPDRQDLFMGGSKTDLDKLIKADDW